jgi:hypothetical protein
MVLVAPQGFTAYEKKGDNVDFHRFPKLVPKQEIRIPAAIFCNILRPFWTT